MELTEWLRAHLKDPAKLMALTGKGSGRSRVIGVVVLVIVGVVV